MCPEVFMTVLVSASEKDFYCFVQRNWHLISTIYINYCFKVCCQETFPRPDSCVLKGKLLLLLLSSVSLHRSLGAFFFYYYFFFTFLSSFRISPFRLSTISYSSSLNLSLQPRLFMHIKYDQLIKLLFYSLYHGSWDCDLRNTGYRKHRDLKAIVIWIHVV